MFNIVKGTHDVIQKEAAKYTYVENLLMREAQVFGYKEFRTPIMEYSELFLRSTGESSDIVRKEMYTFTDKGDRSITLRPEMTAGVIRSMVNEKLFINQDYPVKAFYVGPNFRYERPQQGRYRQFNQFGIECVGVDSPYRDIEVIMLGYSALKLLGFKNIKLEINSLGDAETREKYQAALREYFGKHIETMCDDCKERYKLNVLRILDCKVEHDIEINKDAPIISDYYSEKSKDNFDVITNFLKENEIEYKINNNLVRGLDYYSGIVFEYHYTSSQGKDYGALGGGGHYGSLVKEIGGPDLEGVGFAFGIERLINLMEDDNLFDENEINDPLDCYVMPVNTQNEKISFEVASYLRTNGYSADVCLEHKSMGQMFKKAERRDALYAVIIGDDEEKEKKVNLKNLVSQEQISISLDHLLDKLDELFGENEDEHIHHHD